MKRRRWSSNDIRRLISRAGEEHPKTGGINESVITVNDEVHRVISGFWGGETVVETGYPPSGNNSRYRSGKLRPKAVEYRRTIGWLYKAAQGKRHDGPVAMEIELYKPVGKVPYDVDNALYNILNGLKGIAYRDDDQVTLLTVAKLWPEGDGRVKIRVKKVTPAFRPAS